MNFKNLRGSNEEVGEVERLATTSAKTSSHGIWQLMDCKAMKLAGAYDGVTKEITIEAGILHSNTLGKMSCDKLKSRKISCKNFPEDMEVFHFDLQHLPERQSHRCGFAESKKKSSVRSSWKFRISSACSKMSKLLRASNFAFFCWLGWTWEKTNNGW